MLNGIAGHEDVVTLAHGQSRISKACEDLAGAGVFRAVEAFVYHPGRGKSGFLNARRLHRQRKVAHRLQRDGLLMERIHRDQHVIHASLSQRLSHIAHAHDVPAEEAVGDQLPLGDTSLRRRAVDGAGDLRVEQRLATEGHDGLHIVEVLQLPDSMHSSLLRNVGAVGALHHAAHGAMLAATRAALGQDEFKPVDVQKRVHMVASIHVFHTKVELARRALSMLALMARIPQQPLG